ncbi:MAG: TonB-dependent receptor, partial [Muribaculaceae bacterium]|nr:TonB-dependent receptor [Muribaculaceae bacterium]
VHDLTFLVVAESIIDLSNGFGAIADGQYNEGLMLLTNGLTVTMNNLSNSVSDEVFNSYFFNFGYSYDDRYFLDANLRRDGSSKFAPEHRWSTFWSLGLMWNMKNEKFLQNVNWLDQARLRLSYGTTGNSGIGNYAYMGLVGPYSITYNGKPGWGLTSVENPDLKWETVRAWDLGLNFRVFDHITADIDFYRKETCDMLVNVPVSYTTGYGAILNNIGNMTNTGVDIDIQADIVKTKDWYFGLRANFNYNANRIKSLFDGMDQQAFPSSLLAYTVGHDASEFYMVKYAGVDPQTGEPQWYDKDGNITKEYNVERDSQLLGKSYTAPITGGFGADLRWKGFALRADFAWAAKKYMVNNDRYFLENPSSDNAASYNQMTTMFDIWTHPGQITNIPKFGSTIQFDDHLLEDASFLRLKNLT